MAIHIKETFHSLKQQFLSFPLLVKAFIVVGVILFLGLLLFPLTSKSMLPAGVKDSSSSNSGQRVPSSQPFRYPVGSMAKQSLDYIQSQKRPDGYYEYLSHYDELCLDKKNATTCPFNGTRMYQTTNAWSILAYIAGYTLFDNDIGFLDLASKDSKILNSWCVQDPQRCNWILVQMIKYYEKQPNQEQLSVITSIGEQLLKTQVSQTPMLAAIEVRELAMLYGLTKDNRYLNEAEKRYTQTRIILDDEKKKLVVGTTATPRQECWVMLSAIDLSKYSAVSEQYLDYVKNSLPTLGIQQAYEDYSYPVEIQPCIEAHLELAKVTGDQNTRKWGIYIMNKFIDSHWDGHDSKKLFGEGGTAIINPKSTHVKIDKPYVSLSDSAYTVYLLSLTEEK